MGDILNRLGEAYKNAKTAGGDKNIKVSDAAKQALNVAEKESNEYAQIKKEKNERKFAIAKRIKKIREDRGLSQKEVAEKTGINSVTLSGYEIGRAEPNMEALVRLADLYKVSLDYIAGRTNEDVQLGAQKSTDEESARIRQELKEIKDRIEVIEKKYNV